jgi:hypothetical protein
VTGLAQGQGPTMPGHVESTARHAAPTVGATSHDVPAVLAGPPSGAQVKGPTLPVPDGARYSPAHETDVMPPQRAWEAASIRQHQLGAVGGPLSGKVAAASGGDVSVGAMESVPLTMLTVFGPASGSGSGMAPEGPPQAFRAKRAARQRVSFIGLQRSMRLPCVQGGPLAPLEGAP